MTREEIIKMAKQVGIDIGMWEKLSDTDDVFGYDIDGTHENLEAFAKLVAEQDCVGWFGYDTGLRLWFETNEGDDGAIPLYKTRSKT